MASSFTNAIDLSDESSATGSDHVTNRLERDDASDTLSRDARHHSRGLTLNDVRIKIRRTFQSDDTGEPLSPLKAKVIASIVMIFCGFFVGFAAYREASKNTCCNSLNVSFMYVLCVS